MSEVKRPPTGSYGSCDTCGKPHAEPDYFTPFIFGCVLGALLVALICCGIEMYGKIDKRIERLESNKYEHRR